VHEHVEAGVDGREFLTPALAQEDGARQLLAQRGLGRPGTDDDQPDPSSAVIPASRSTRFSVARRPTYPAISSPPGATSARICGLCLAGWKRCVSTPRPHSQTFSMPWPSRPVAVTVDGASVRTAPLWMPRSHRQANASPAWPNR
jgi:hypothetical protein